jgi:BioD-like phosphotransacetylase family protein
MKGEVGMSKTVYVTSTQNFSGKSALCVGLLRRLKEDGFAIGYMKPVSTTARIVGERVVDEDAQFMKFHFELSEPLEALAPVILTDQRVAGVLAGEQEDLTSTVLSAFEVVAKDKDVVVLEGGGSLREGWIVNLAPPHMSKLLNTRELVVVPYDSDLQLVDDLITARVRLADSLLGAVINRVPKHRLDFVKNQVKPFVERHGVPVFGILLREKVLLSVSVAELAEGVGGEILCAQESLENLVEHFLVAAMTVESALKYFRRQPNNAVITGGDRADIHLAALETSTRCLILTGNIRPSAQIIGRAEERGVPIILTRQDTMTAIERIEKFFGKTRFHQEKKVLLFQTLLEQYLDFAALYRALGLRRPNASHPKG